MHFNLKKKKICVTNKVYFEYKVWTMKSLLGMCYLLSLKKHLKAIYERERERERDCFNVITQINRYQKMFVDDHLNTKAQEA